MKKIITILVSTVTLCQVFAGGFRVTLQGNTQFATGNTTAHTEDASVVFYNPAGMSFIPSKLNISGGLIPITSKATVRMPAIGYEHSSKMGWTTPFYANIAYKVTDKFSVGFSATSPFGSSVDWGKDWIGKAMSTKITLQAINLQPTLAYRFNDWLSVGAGYVYSTGSVNMQKRVPAGALIPGMESLGDLDLTIRDKKATGSGYNIGVYLKPTKKFDVSLAYRSLVKVKSNDGGIDITSVEHPDLLNTTAKFSAEIPLAAELSLGLAYHISDKWSVYGDWNLASWNKYETLKLDIEGLPVVGNHTIEEKKNFFTTNNFRVGAEYRANDKLTIRMGSNLDRSPVSDEYWSPETPSSTNLTFSTGIGYKISESVEINASAGYIAGLSREIKNNTTGKPFYGNNRTKAFALGAGISWDIIK